MKKPISQLFRIQELLIKINVCLRKTIIPLFYLSAIMAATAQSPSFQWVKSIVGLHSSATGNSFKIDEDRNVFSCGSFQGSVDFDPGKDTFKLKSLNGDIYISKLDENGSFVWAKSIGGDRSCEAYSITMDAFGNLYVTGLFEGTIDFDPGNGIYNLISNGKRDMFILKIDSSGNFIWAKQTGGLGNDLAFSIDIDDSSNIYYTGIFEQTIDFDPGPGTYYLGTPSTTVFVSKLDSSGRFQWARNLEGIPVSAFSSSIKLDSKKNIFLTGSFEGKVDFNPGKGNFTLTTIAGNSDAFILKLDLNGNFIWVKSLNSIGSSSGTFGNSIAADSWGSVYLTGTFMGNVDFNPDIDTLLINSKGISNCFVLKLDANGKFIWAKTFGGQYNDGGMGITLDKLGNPYIIGGFGETVDFDPGINSFNLTSKGLSDIFISKFDIYGNFIWAIALGGEFNDFGNALGTDEFGNIYTLGKYSDRIDFNCGSDSFYLTPYFFDVFLLKMNQISYGVPDYAIRKNIQITPNPSNGKFEVNFPSIESDVKIEIYDARGILVLTDYINTGDIIDLSKYANGVYNVKVIDHEKSFSTSRIVKMD